MEPGGSKGIKPKRKREEAYRRVLFFYPFKSGLSRGNPAGHRLSCGRPHDRNI